MALKAGYYGLKNSVKRTLEKLAADMSGAKIIKTIGNGLELTQAGKLNVKVGEGLSIDSDGNITAAGGVGSWTALSETATTGTTEIEFPSGFEAEEIMIVAKCALTGYNVGASMVLNVASISSTTYYYDFGAGSADAFFLRYGVTDEGIVLNTAKANNQSVAASVETMVYYR